MRRTVIHEFSLRFDKLRSGRQVEKAEQDFLLCYTILFVTGDSAVDTKCVAIPSAALVNIRDHQNLDVVQQLNSVAPGHVCTVHILDFRNH